MADQSSRNKPSDNSDLEQYGIWVKSEPQDIIEEPEDIFSDTGLEDALLAEPEAVEFTGQSTDFGEDIETIDMQIDEDSIIDIPLEDLPDDPLPQPKQPTVSNNAPTSNANVSSASIDEISLDDFLDDDSGSVSNESTNHIESVSLDDFSVDSAIPENDEPLDPELEDIESIDLDLQFDDTIETPLDTIEEDIFSSDDIEGMDLLDTTASESLDVSDFETSLPADENTTADINENVDISAMFIDTTDTKPTNPEKAKEQTSSRAVPDHSTNLDSFIDNEDSLPLQHLSMEELGAEPDISSASKSSGSDISINLLNQIAQELSTIKSELASLKSQLQTGQVRPNGDLSAQVKQTDESKGFFEEEDDETIALTGDELENILNTASFTVEASETPDESERLSSDEMQSEILPEDGDYTSEQKGIELVDASEEEVDISLLDESSSLNAEDIVETITPSTRLEPDEVVLADASELVESTQIMENTESFDLEELQEIPLEEPDLSGLDLPSTVGELNTTLDDTGNDQQISFSHPDESVMDRIVLSIDGSEEKEQFVESSSVPEIEELEDIGAETVQLSDELLLDVVDEDKIGSRHPDEITTQLDDSLFIENKPQPSIVTPKQEPAQKPSDMSVKLKKDIKTVLLYLDQLLAALPEDKIEEFAQSEYYDTYKKLFEELGII